MFSSLETSPKMKSLKVGCIGNMNNSMYCLTRYLRDRGIDAELLLLSLEQSHFLPSNDSTSEDWRIYTRQLAWGSPESFDTTHPQRIAEDLAPYEFLVGCNFAPAFIQRAGRILDIFCPHGSDYLEVPFYPGADGKSLSNLALAQQAAIRDTPTIFCPFQFVEREEGWKRLEKRGERFFMPIPFIYLPAYSDEKIQELAANSAPYVKMRALREAHDLLIFNHSRHVWASPERAYDFKGSDVLLRGFAEFLRQRPQTKACLATFEYGPDVAASKELIKTLGIEDRVFWFPQSNRREIMPCLALADIACSEFVFSGLLSCVICESLAMGKPILGKRLDETYDWKYDKLYPMLNAATPSEVAARLIASCDDTSHLARLGAEGRLWLEQVCINPTLDKMEQLIRQKSLAGK
jgi:glycosyltransferase involved in cell wall biosynthesis